MAQISEQQVSFTSRGQTITGTLRKPTATTPEPKPPLLMIGEAGHDQPAGFTALAPQLAERGTFSLQFVLPAGSPDENLQDARAAFDFLAAQEGIRKDRIGVLGFGDGGMLASYLGGEHPNVWKIALWSCGPSGEALTTLMKTESPVLMVYGTQDDHVTADDIKKSKLALELQQGLNVYLVPIDGADHAFSQSQWQQKAIAETLRWII